MILTELRSSDACPGPPAVARGRAGGGPPRSMNNALMRDRPSTDLVIDDVQSPCEFASPARRRMRLTIGPRRPPRSSYPDMFQQRRLANSSSRIAAGSRESSSGTCDHGSPPEFCVERPWTVWLAGKPVRLPTPNPGEPWRVSKMASCCGWRSIGCHRRDRAVVSPRIAWRTTGLAEIEASD